MRPLKAVQCPTSPIIFLLLKCSRHVVCTPKRRHTMTKAKSKNSKSTTTAKRQAKPQKEKPAIAENSDCPYRSGTLYETLFTEGNRDYIAKDELIHKVAEQTGKSEK